MKDQYSPCDLIDFIIRFMMVYTREMSSGKSRNDMMKSMYSLEKKCSKIRKLLQRNSQLCMIKKNSIQFNDKKHIRCKSYIQYKKIHL